MYFQRPEAAVDTFLNNYDSHLPTHGQRLLVAKTMATFIKPDYDLLTTAEQNALNAARLGSYASRRILTANWASPRIELAKLANYTYGIQPTATEFADQTMLIFTKGVPEAASTKDSDLEIIFGTITRQEADTSDEQPDANVLMVAKGITADPASLYPTHIEAAAGICLRGACVVRRTDGIVNISKNSNRVTPVTVLKTRTSLANDTVIYQQERQEVLREVVLGTSTSRGLLKTVVDASKAMLAQRTDLLNKVEATITAGNPALAA